MTSFKVLEFSVIVLLLFTIKSSNSSCPNVESISPCYCIRSSSGYKTIVCSGLDNAEQLTEIIAQLRGSIIDRFLILGSFTKPRIVTEAYSDYYGNEKFHETSEVVPEIIPSDWLENVRVLELEIYSSVLSLSFLDLLVQEQFLQTLTVSHSITNESYLTHYVSNDSSTDQLALANLGQLKSLRYLDFAHNYITGIYKDAFPKTLTSLEKIDLSHNIIRWIRKNAFNGLKSLRHLDLSHNKLLNVYGSDFDPLKDSLQLLDLSWNYITALPSNLFHNMTELKDVRFKHNFLQVLPATIFAGFEKQISIHVQDNFIVCDCRLSWILKAKFRIFGTCALPREIAFYDISPGLPTLQNCSEGFQLQKLIH